MNSVGGESENQQNESIRREYADIKGAAPVLCKILADETIAVDFPAILRA